MPATQTAPVLTRRQLNRVAARPSVAARAACRHGRGDDRAPRRHAGAGAVRPVHGALVAARAASNRRSSAS